MVKKKRVLALLLSCAITLTSIGLTGSSKTYAEVSENDFDVNTAWNMSEDITTEYTVKDGNKAYSTGNAKIGDIGVTAKFVKQADRNDGASYLSANGNNQAAYAATSDMFYGKPNPASIPALGINAQPSNGCGGELNTYEKANYNGHAEVGTVTITFDQAVTDPILDLSGLGGYVNWFAQFQLSNGNWDIVGRGSFNNTDIELITDGVSFEKGASNSNLEVTDNWIKVKDRNTFTHATLTKGEYIWNGNYNSPKLEPAGTGSVILKGTFKEVSLKLYHNATPWSAFPTDTYGTSRIFFTNYNDSRYGDGINGINVVNTERLPIGNDTINGTQNWDLFRVSLRLPKTSSIGDKVWLDENSNGIQDAGEKGVAGVTVKLLDKDGNPAKDFNGNEVPDQVTDANGNYKFENLPVGEYTVQVVPKDEQSLTTKGQGTADIDSDVDPATGKTDVITLEANREITNVDAGIVPAKEYKVDYEFKPSKAVGTPETLPEGVLKQLPEAKEKLTDGTEVPSPKDFTPVKDEENGGTWTFEKWDKDTATINGKDEHVTGTWVFTKDEQPKPEEHKVTHEFKSGTPEKELPEEVRKLLPKDQTGKVDGTTVVPTEPNPTEVTTNEGTWTFKGYDRTEATIDGKDEHFVGTWEFTPKEQPKPETGSVYVKYVTEDGKELEAEKEVLVNAEVGTKYTTEQKTFDGYEFVEMAKDSAPANGKVEKGDQHVTYVYKKTEVTPPVEEKGNVYVKYVTEDGEVLEAESTVKKDAPVGEAYTTEEKTFDGYEFVKLEDGSAPANGEVEKGDQHVTYVYKKKEVTPPADVVTEYVDEDGKTIAPQENGTKDKKDIPGYEFVETKTDDKGNTKHIYKKKTTPSPTVETRYVDTEGNQILADKAGTHDPSTIEGYQFVRTDKDKNDNTIHVYKKIAPVPKVETRYVDENGNQLLPPKEGEQGSVAIDGYNYIRTSKDNDGNTIHTYSKTPFEGVETKFVDTDGNQILDDKAGTHDASTIEGYQLVRTDKDENGNTIHVYKKIAPAPKVETRYVDVNGNQLLLPKEGTQAQETIEGYEFVKTETDEKGNTKHIYKKKTTTPTTHVVTEYVDENGKTIAPKVNGKQTNKDIYGYEFVKTETDEKGNTKHIYKKKTTSPTTDVVTEYVDENGKTIAPKENGTKDKKDIDGYEFVKNEKDEKGNTKHIYKKKTNTRPITQGNNTINSSSPNKKGTLVNTGDGVNASTYAIIMLAIGAVLTGIGIRKKKKEA